ncbi:2-hydroxyacyl-CoA dehydratase subunit D [Desulfocicer niacini]
MTPSTPRLARLKKRTTALMQKEVEEQITLIRNRFDYTEHLEPFINTLGKILFMDEFIDNAQKNVIMTPCIQAPLELFHAAKVQPFRLACGAFAVQNMAPLHLPALTCPMIKSISGLLEMNSVSGTPLVIPTTCDWVVKFSELTGLYDTAEIHFMELPHLREAERSSKRWHNEIKIFKNWLEKTIGHKISSKRLLNAIKIHAKASELYNRLINLRRQQVIPSLHFALIANALSYQDIETWMRAVDLYILNHREPEIGTVPVFLSGSPIAFPNYKMLTLIENAGMSVTADDLCTMERTFQGSTPYEDTSEFSLLKALAQRYQKACSCPTFADNQRRLNAMVHTLEQHSIKGVIFHVLKGCHPYDMEAGILENQLKHRGIRFLKIETDYVKEDEQNIVTRLEAFKRTLRSKTS